jgi:hypothetical protein
VLKNRCCGLQLDMLGNVIEWKMALALTNIFDWVKTQLEGKIRYFILNRLFVSSDGLGSKNDLKQLSGIQ